MPSTERTLVLVKPDGVQRQLVGRILARYEERGLKVVGLKLVQTSTATSPSATTPSIASGRSSAASSTSSRRAPLVAARARGPERDRRRPGDQRRDPAARGRAGHDPRRLRARDRPEHRPRVGRPGGGRRSSSALWFEADELSRLRARPSIAGCCRRPSRRRGSGGGLARGPCPAGRQPGRPPPDRRRPRSRSAAADQRPSTSDSAVTPSDPVAPQDSRPARAADVGHVERRPCRSPAPRRAPIALSSRRRPRPRTRT